MSETRLKEINQEIDKMRALYASNDYESGDQILYQIESRHLDWLVGQAKKAQMYEDTLKFCQFQLKNGGQGKRTRITQAVDKALEGEFNE